MSRRSGFLHQAVAEARLRVAADAAAEPLARLNGRARLSLVPPRFDDALRVDGGPHIIAEVKRASPSRGHLADIPDPVALACAYEEGGAAAVSVLTEPTHFRGSLDDLEAVAAAVTVPVLRKDFIVDEYQIVQARAAGASAVLLIVAALEHSQLARLIVDAANWRLTALVETHSRDEIMRAADAYAASEVTTPLVLGVNTRNLATLEVDMSIFEGLHDALPNGAVIVAESGVTGPADVARFTAYGAHAVLVGEHLSTSPDPVAAVAALRSLP